MSLKSYLIKSRVKDVLYFQIKKQNKPFDKLDSISDDIVNRIKAKVPYPSIWNGYGTDDKVKYID